MSVSATDALRTDAMNVTRKNTTYLNARPRIYIGVGLCVFAAIILFAVSEMSKTSTSHTINQYVTPQENVNYIGKWLIVQFKSLTNVNIRSKSIAQITLTNSGNRHISPGTWVIYFTTAYSIKGDMSIEMKGVKNAEFSIRPVKAWFYVIEQISFEGLSPGRNTTIIVAGVGHTIKRSDSMPNWYVAGPGVEPRVIESTRDETLSFVAEYQKNESRKLGSRDILYPWSAKQRFNRATLPTEPQPSSRYDVLPSPKLINVTPTRLVSVYSWWWSIVVLYEDRSLLSAAKFLKDKMTWSRVRSDIGAASSYCIQFVLGAPSVDGNIGISNQSYTLRINHDLPKVTITAQHASGAFYAVQTLLSLLGDDYLLPHGFIADEPRFLYRGVHLDVARNFRSVADVTHLIDVMSTYKLNKLHLHLSDDEGWRLEIPDLPELTRLGSKRCHDPTETRCLLPFLGAGPYPSTSGTGFYTTTEYRHILRYANERHVEVIPEIDLPGHARAAIKSMSLRNKEKKEKGDVQGADEYMLAEPRDQSQYKSVQGYNDSVINPCIPSTYTFITTIISTIQNLHKDISDLRIFHFGGDEIPRTAWRSSPSCSRMNYAHGKLKEYFVEKLGALVMKFKGVSLAAWEDGMSTKTRQFNVFNRARVTPDRDIFVYPWNNLWELQAAGNAYILANAGFKVIMSHATSLYLDHSHEPDPEEKGLYWASRFTDLRKVFMFKPLNIYDLIDTNIFGNKLPMNVACGNSMMKCPELTEEQNIVGMEVHLWGELIRTRAAMDSQLFPRTLAMAERAWHKAKWEEEGYVKSSRSLKTHDFARFLNLVGYKELGRLDKLGVQYRISPPGAKIVSGALVANTEPPGLTIEYSLNDGCTWIIYIRNEKVPPNVKILLRTRSQDNKRHSRVVFINKSGIVLECPAWTMSVNSPKVLLCLAILLLLVIRFIPHSFTRMIATSLGLITTLISRLKCNFTPITVMHK